MRKEWSSPASLCQLFESLNHRPPSGESTFVLNCRISVTSIWFYLQAMLLMTISANNSFSLLWATQPSPNLVFGFSAVNTTLATSVTSIQACQLLSNLVANICVRELDQVIYTGSSNQISSLFQIPLASGSSYLIVYEPQKPQIQLLNHVYFLDYMRSKQAWTRLLGPLRNDWSFLMTLYR
jgi:hypothetical protein